ncbi:MAG TPA: TlpA disulfide reductase family protein [Ktedonobacterales bacterium]
MRVLAPVGMSRRSLIGFVLTTLASAALLVLLFVRLLNASQLSNAATGSPLVGHPAPAFTLTLLNGQPGQKLTLDSLKGKPIVLNFWASWCEGCKEEAPILEAAAKRYAGQGVVVVGVATQDTQADSLAFLRQYGVTYQTGTDSDGAISVAYGVTGLPETVFIGRDGQIDFKFGGQIDEASLRNHVQALLK